MVARIGRERDVVARHALDPGERPRADGLVDEGGFVGVGFLLEDVLRHEERPRQDGRIGRVGLVHPPGQLRRAHHGDVAHEFVAGATTRQELGVLDQLDVVFDVVGRERCAVMPFDTGLQLDAPVEAVGRDAAVLDGRDLGHEVGDEVALGVAPPERAEQVEIDRLVDLDMDQQRVEDRGFLGQADHRLARGLRGRCRGIGLRIPPGFRAEPGHRAERGAQGQKLTAARTPRGSRMGGLIVVHRSVLRSVRADRIRWPADLGQIPAIGRGLDPSL